MAEIQSLANKYRPTDWSDMVEQSLVVETLRKVCEAEEISQRNFLFVGPAGTGKTTLSRIISNKLNNGVGEIIEIDAASNSGADAMRNTANQAKTYPVIGKYKTIIIDECFSPDTMIKTVDGEKPICDVKVGDFVYNLDGITKVSNVFENVVPKSHLLKVHMSNGQSIITTIEHLFFTDCGWIAAKSLQKGDILYDYQEVCDLRKGIQQPSFRQSDGLRSGMWRSFAEAEFDDISCESNKERIYERLSDMWKDFLHTKVDQRYNLFSGVFNCVEEAARTFTEAEREFIEAQTRIYLSDMRKVYAAFTLQEQKDLFSCLHGKAANPDISTREACEAIILYDMWCSVLSKIEGSTDLQPSLQASADRSPSDWSFKAGIFRTHERGQSDVQSRYNREDEANQRAKWYFASAFCESWRQWFINTASDAVTASIGIQLDNRISSENRNKAEQQSDAVSYILQSRPCLYRYKAGDRGGWCNARREASAIAGRKENQVLGTVRVESIEVYEPGNNDQSFRSCLSGADSDSGYVTLYDLEIQGHSSYYANGVLVHNCHSLSNQGWQVLLKVLEESPARTIFFFCTTNPEKIPDTILSRVQEFHLSKISLSGIENRVTAVLDAEIADGRQIEYTADGVSFLAKLAAGGMRKALTLLDTLLTRTSVINSETVASIVNINYDSYFRLLGAISKRDNEKIAAVVDEVYNSGVNFTKWFEDFHGFIMNIVKFILLQDINRTMIPAHYQDKISKYTISHFTVCMKLANVLLSLNQDLRSTNYPQEVVLTKLCTIPSK